MNVYSIIIDINNDDDLLLLDLRKDEQLDYVYFYSKVYNKIDSIEERINIITNSKYLYLVEGNIYIFAVDMEYVDIINTEFFYYKCKIININDYAWNKSTINVIEPQKTIEEDVRIIDYEKLPIELKGKFQETSIKCYNCDNLYNNQILIFPDIIEYSINLKLIKLMNFGETILGFYEKPNKALVSWFIDTRKNLYEIPEVEVNEDDYSVKNYDFNGES